MSVPAAGSPFETGNLTSEVQMRMNRECFACSLTLVATVASFCVFAAAAGARAATAPQNTSLPTITGVPEEGETLVGDRGQWTGTEPISYAAQWRRCDAAGGNCVNLAGAT